VVYGDMATCGHGLQRSDASTKHVVSEQGDKAQNNTQLYSPKNGSTKKTRNSSADEIANVNFYAVRPEATRIR